MKEKTPGKRRAGRWASAALLLLWLATVLALTLSPRAATTEPSAGCLLCGERAVADAILNVVLFLPAGMALARLGVHPARVLAMAFVLSSAIELTQLVLPGRFATPLDVASNALGGLLGALALRPLPTGILPAIGGTGALALLLWGTAWLGGSRPWEGAAYAQWAPVVDAVGYGGRVLGVAVAGRSLPDGRIRDPTLEKALRAGEPLSVRFAVGPAPARRAPLFAIADRTGHTDILFVRGRDLAYTYGTRAAAVRLDQPFVILRDALAGTGTGDEAIAQVRRGRDGVELGIRSGAGAASVRTRPSSARGWVFLFSAPLGSAVVTRVLDTLWILAWTLPIGIVVGAWRPASAIALVVVAIMLALPPLLGITAAPGAAATAGVGVLAGNLLRAWRRPPID